MKNLFSFITLLILVHTTTEAQPDPVLDMDGNKLLRSEIYYLVPVTKPGIGPGIVLYALPNENCSFGVVQLPMVGDGLPLIFKPANSSGLGGEIHDFTDLDISFSSSIGCGPSDLWKRGEYDEAAEQYFVEIGGVRRKHEIGTLGDAFQIRKTSGGYYKFVFCPATCVSCYRKCYDVVIFLQYGLKRLAVSGDLTAMNTRFRKYVPELARY